MLDTQSGVIHIFRSLKQDKPSESFSISNGTFAEKSSKFTIEAKSPVADHRLYVGILSDPETGKLLDSFEFRTQSNLQFTVVSEDSASVA